MKCAIYLPSNTTQPNLLDKQLFNQFFEPTIDLLNCGKTRFNFSVRVGGGDVNDLFALVLLNLVPVDFDFLQRDMHALTRLVALITVKI